MPRTSKVEQVLLMQHRLTPRDWRLLGWLYDHQLFTTDQIADALFRSLHAAQVRLRTLTEYGVLLRFQPYRIQGGNFPYHYVIGHLGATIIAASRSQSPPRLGQSDLRVQRIVNSRNTNHWLGINSFFTQLAKYERLSEEEATLNHWLPDNQSRYFSPPGTTMIAPVKPDGLGVWTENDRTVAFYYEHDEGTESLPTLLDKVERYNRLPDARWPVLFSFPTTVREGHFHAKLAAMKPKIPIATIAHDRLGGATPAEIVWHVHSAAAPLMRLAELPMQSPVNLEAFDAEAQGKFVQPLSADTT